MSLRYWMGEQVSEFIIEIVNAWLSDLFSEQVHALIIEIMNAWLSD